MATSRCRAGTTARIAIDEAFRQARQTARDIAEKNSASSNPASRHHLQTGAASAHPGRICHHQGKPWPGEGDLSCWGQHSVELPKASKNQRQAGKADRDTVPKNGSLGEPLTPAIETISHGTRVTHGDLRCEFDDLGLTSIHFDGRPIALGGPEPNFWRAPMDNDGIKGGPAGSSRRWIDGKIKASLKQRIMSNSSPSASSETRSSASPKGTSRARWASSGTAQK